MSAVPDAGGALVNLRSPPAPRAAHQVRDAAAPPRTSRAATPRAPCSAPCRGHDHVPRAPVACPDLPGCSVARAWLLAATPTPAAHPRPQAAALAPPDTGQKTILAALKLPEPPLVRLHRSQRLTSPPAPADVVVTRPLNALRAYPQVDSPLHPRVLMSFGSPDRDGHRDHQQDQNHRRCRRPRRRPRRRSAVQ